MDRKWWHDRIGYQVYPKSFLDTDGDGIGDLKGIIRKLDYLQELGIDILWISPVYPSPMVDNGYDIADYYGIDSRFGTMEDMELLLAEAKKRNIHVLMDLVVNHTSDQHEWFQKALADPDGEYGQYYYFKDGIDGRPPTNWRSYFGGSVWEKVPGYDNKFYLHLFAKEQPDLNWENKALREEIYRMVNWWLDKGIDGFRIDAIINIKKDLEWESYPADNTDGLCDVRNMLKKATGIGKFLGELRDRCFLPHGAFTVGEVFDLKEEELADFVGDNGYFSTMFAFEHVMVHYGENGWYDNGEVQFVKWRDTIFKNQLKLQEIGFESNIIENHDEPRGASHFIPEKDYGFYSVSALATLMILLRGLPFLYQGQEIGMTNCPFSSIEEYDDIETKDQYALAIESGCSEKEALLACYRQSRDNCRTPMQWDASANAGFTTGTPWLKVNPNYKEINVLAQEQEYGSVLNFYRRLLAFRKSEEYRELFTYGEFAPAYEEYDTVFAYYRTLGSKRVLVLCNYCAEPCSVKLKETYENVVFVNYPQVTCVGDMLTLEPYQVVVAELSLA